MIVEHQSTAPPEDVPSLLGQRVYQTFVSLVRRSDCRPRAHRSHCLFEREALGHTLSEGCRQAGYSSEPGRRDARFGCRIHRLLQSLCDTDAGLCTARRQPKTYSFYWQHSASRPLVSELTRPWLRYLGRMTGRPGSRHGSAISLPGTEQGQLGTCCPRDEYGRSVRQIGWPRGQQAQGVRADTPQNHLPLPR